MKTKHNAAVTNDINVLAKIYHIASKCCMTLRIRIKHLQKNLDISLFYAEYNTQIVLTIILCCKFFKKKICDKCGILLNNIVYPLHIMLSKH